MAMNAIHIVEKPAASPGRAKVLIVDDEPKNLIALEAILAGVGDELVSARSGEEALRCLLRDDFALILLDVQMSGMDGFETAACIRERRKTRDTPIIFITAFGKDERQVFRGYSAGAIDYVFKPFEPEVLRCKVTAFVNLFRQSEALRRQAAELERMNAQLQFANQELNTLYGKVRELEEAKSEFFANVSHDLRTPLSLILGPLEKLQRGNSLEHEQREAVEMMSRNAQQLLQRVNDLLEVSRLDAGRARLRLVDADLAELLRLAAANFDILARERRILFALDIPESVPCRVDAEQMQRVFLNLLSNAFKFTPADGVIHCRLQVENELAEIDVEDSGPGIALEMRQRIFERFQQADDGASGGTGIGLSIVKDFVELHGGTVEVDSAAQGGALFRVLLPVAPRSSAVVALPSTAAAAAEDCAGTTTLERATRADAPAVLIVEDNPDMRRFLTAILSEEYAVSSAANGREGLARARELRPDLVITDVMMPEMNGEEFVRELRSDHDFDSIPVLVLTAKADNTLRVQLLSHGAQDYLCKPFLAAELQARVTNLVQMKRLHDLLRREVTSQERDVVALVLELISNRAELEKALATVKEAEEKLQRHASDLEAHVAQRTAELRESNLELEDFTQTVSHDLRAPLRTIMGFADALLSDYGERLDETGRDYAQRIIAAVYRMDELTRDLLSYSSVSHGELPLAPVRAQDLVQQAVEGLQGEIEAAGANVEVKIRKNISSVIAHPGTLMQAITNLLTNAIKFAKPGEKPKVRVWADERDSRVRLWVEDAGIGIAPEYHDVVFGIFERLHTSEDYPGTGIGLAIVQKGMQRMRGSVGVKSASGQGSRFWLELPKAAGSAKMEEHDATNTSRTAGRGQS